MFQDYLNIMRLKDFDIKLVKDLNCLFSNEEELFDLLTKKDFKAYRIELKDVIRNSSFLEFLRTKYAGISNHELSELTEFLLISDIDQLSKLSKDDMYNKRKSTVFVINEIWGQFINNIRVKTKLYLYQYGYEFFEIDDVLKQNQLDYLMKPIGEDVLIEYSDQLINYYDSSVNLIGLIPFNIYITGFNNETQIDINNLENDMDNVEIFWFIHNDLGYSTILANKNITII